MSLLHTSDLAQILTKQIVTFQSHQNDQLASQYMYTIINFGCKSCIWLLSQSELKLPAVTDLFIGHLTYPRLLILTFTVHSSLADLGVHCSVQITSRKKFRDLNVLFTPNFEHPKQIFFNQVQQRMVKTYTEAYSMTKLITDCVEG